MTEYVVDLSEEAVRPIAAAELAESGYTAPPNGDAYRCFMRIIERIRSNAKPAEAVEADRKGRPMFNVDLSDEVAEEWVEAKNYAGTWVQNILSEYLAHLRSTAKPVESVRTAAGDAEKAWNLLRDLAVTKLERVTEKCHDGSVVSTWRAVGRGSYIENSDPMDAVLASQPKEPTWEEDCNTISRIPGPMSAEDSIEFSHALNRIRKRLGEKPQ